MRLSVIGTGYLGATHAAAMASLGHEVIGLDIDQAKVDAMARGEVPFHEPELSTMLREQVRAGRLRMTTSYEEVCEFADVHFVCVGTPQKRGSEAADTTFVDAAFEALASKAVKDALLVGKSTVPVGTAASLSRQVSELSPKGVELEVAWNPEFLREGFAVQDTVNPDRLVFGVRSDRAERALREIFAAPISQGSPVVVTDFETAELVKAAANSFLATKISFINAVSEITEVVGGDIRVLADAIGLDDRIGRKFLNAGVGFGGGCLPKDIRAFRARASELGLADAMGILAEVDAVNLRSRERLVEMATRLLGGLENKKVAILGAAFKPDSDDVRDSPALDVAARLYERGADVHVTDPKAIENARKRFPRLDYREDVENAVQGVDLVVLATEWSLYKQLDPQRLRELVATPILLEGRAAVDTERWERAGWRVEALGRKLQHCGEDR